MGPIKEKLLWDRVQWLAEVATHLLLERLHKNAGKDETFYALLSRGNELGAREQKMVNAEQTASAFLRGGL